MAQQIEKIVFNSVLNFRRVTHFCLCLLETQVTLTDIETQRLNWPSGPRKQGVDLLL